MTNRYQAFIDGICDVLDREIPRLLALTDEQVSIRRNHQSRTVKMLVGHLIDSASNNHQRMVRLVNHNHPRFFLYLVIVLRQPLYRHRLYRHHVRNRINRRGRSCSKAVANPLSKAVPKFLSRPQASSSKTVIPIVSEVDGNAKHADSW